MTNYFPEYEQRTLYGALVVTLGHVTVPYKNCCFIIITPVWL